MGLFKTIQGKHQKLADNYLSLKAYAAVSKINGLVNEYIEVVNGVRMRWPMGLGKYLLFQDQWPRQRVHRGCERCSHALANGSRQVPPVQARACHVQEGCPSGRQGPGQVRQLRVH